MNIKQNKRNSSIDIFRLFCAFLVVIIHTRPFEDQNAILGFWVVQIMPRIAVPFFFCISGYYYLQRLNSNGHKEIWKTFSNVLKIYVCWTGIYFLRDFFVNVFTNTLSWKGLIFDFILKFFVYGSEYHFWFFIALLLSIIIVGFAHKYNKMKILFVISLFAYFIGLLGESYYAVGNKIPLINFFINIGCFEQIRRILLMGLPFFMAGVVIDYIKKSDKRSNYTWLSISIVGFLLENYFVVYYGIQRSIIVTIFLYPFVVGTVCFLLEHPLYGKESIAKKSNSLSSYIFYVHPLIIWGINIIIEKIGTRLLNIELYVITCVICVVTWRLLYMSKSRFIHKNIL